MSVGLICLSSNVVQATRNNPTFVAVQKASFYLPGQRLYPK